MNKIIMLLIASLMILLGLIGLFWPTGLMELAKGTFTRQGLYIAAALRIAIGTSILIAADATAAPKIVRVLGAIIIIAGIATAFLDIKTAQQIADWWFHRGHGRIRLTACLPLATGLFLGGVTIFRKP